jgi:hypothetical protein
VNAHDHLYRETILDPHPNSGGRRSAQTASGITGGRDALLENVASERASAAQLTTEANALCETFFATLQCELLNRNSFKTQAQARTAVFEFVEGWYNPHRRHSALDYLSPIDYERRHAAGSNVDQQQQTAAPPPLTAGKIEDNVIKVNCIGEVSNQSPSPTPSTKTG